MTAPQEVPRAGKPGPLKLAKIVILGILMIGKKGTWEAGGDGAHMTTGQIVAAGLIGGVLLVVLLIGLVRVMLALASG